MRVIEGSIFDVAVDIRQGSPSFGQWVESNLPQTIGNSYGYPPDFAHGFVVTSKSAQVLYKATDFYSPDHERSIAWNDETIGIEWPDIGMTSILSAKDAEASSLESADLPSYNP